MSDASDSPIRIGALAPLSPPGWVEAGRHLLAGLDFGVEEVNAGGGIAGRPLELLVRDTAADPQRATAAMHELAGLGAAAVTGEFHSVVALAAADAADALRLPFLCTSAVLDELIDRPTDWVARLAPIQSRGWGRYADYLLGAGHRRIAVAAEPSVYWASGARILSERLAPHDGAVAELDAALPPADLCDAVAAGGATALLLLCGHPEPAVLIVRAVRADPRLTGLLIGAPAGQPELPGWHEALGPDGAAIPFLRYLPPTPDARAERVGTALARRLGQPPSFVALEGHDAIAVLATALRGHGTDRKALAAAWPHLAVDGTRGPIRFARVDGLGAWQWAWAPIQVADRDPAAPERFRVLHDGG